MKHEQLKEFILESLSEKKAENITYIEIAPEISLADYMIFASGRSIKNIRAIGESVALKLKRANVYAKIEGQENSDWILLDAGSVIVHIFHPEAREKFKLEELWNTKK